MPWNGTNGFYYTEPSITANAPAASGVYAIYRQGHWIYIGESGSIRDRLLEHIRRQENQCIVQSNPTHFAYELVAAAYRVQRQNELIAELHPSCNQRFG
jgi:excinuclease UvrABC nuclease subunit